MWESTRALGSPTWFVHRPSDCPFALPHILPVYCAFTTLLTLLASKCERLKFPSFVVKLVSRRTQDKLHPASIQNKTIITTSAAVVKDSFFTMVEFNKMFVMLPLVFAARKIDGEDPQIIFYLRIAYFSVQSLIVLFTLYTYLQATLAAKGKETMVIYVPPPAQVCAHFSQVSNNCHLVYKSRWHTFSDCFLFSDCGRDMGDEISLDQPVSRIIGKIRNNIK